MFLIHFTHNSSKCCFKRIKLKSPQGLSRIQTWLKPLLSLPAAEREQASSRRNQNPHTSQDLPGRAPGFEVQLEHGDFWACRQLSFAQMPWPAFQPRLCEENEKIKSVFMLFWSNWYDPKSSRRLVSRFLFGPHCGLINSWSWQGPQSPFSCLQTGLTKFLNKQ